MILDNYGAPSNLRAGTWPKPEIDLDSNDILVKVRACGLCYHDLMTLAGKIPWTKPPLVVGHEIAGEVVAVGRKVRSLQEGDRVASIQRLPCGVCEFCRAGSDNLCRNGFLGEDFPGGYAEFVRLTENAVCKLPASITSFEEASILACAVGTTLHAMLKVKLGIGDRVLITGAGGGLGVHAVQLAKSAGSTVIAVTTSPQKVEEIRKFGADHVILSSRPDFSDEVKKVTAGRGATYALEIVGSATFDSSMRSLAPTGKLVILGDLMVSPVQLRPTYALYKEIDIISSHSTSQRDLAQVIDLVTSGRIKPIVSTVVPLEQIADGFAKMQDRSAVGRVVVTP